MRIRLLLVIHILFSFWVSFPTQGMILRSAQNLTDFLPVNNGYETGYFQKLDQFLDFRREQPKDINASNRDQILEGIGIYTDFLGTATNAAPEEKLFRAIQKLYRLSSNGDVNGLVKD